MGPIQLFLVWCIWSRINEFSIPFVWLSLGEKKMGLNQSLHKKRSFPLKISSVNVTKLVTFTDEMLNRKLYFLCSELFLYDAFDQSWYEFQLKYLCFCFGFCKIEVPGSIFRDLWCYQSWKIAIESSESKKFLTSSTHFFFWWRLGRSFEMVKRNLGFREINKVLQKHELCSKGKVHIMDFLDKGNVDIMDFWE